MPGTLAFIITIKNWELDYCPDGGEWNIWKAITSSPEFHCPLPHEPKGLISTASCWWWWRGAGRMLTIFPFWPTSRLRSQRGFAGMEPEKKHRPHTGMCAELAGWCMCFLPLTHTFLSVCLIYNLIRTLDYVIWSLHWNHCFFFFSKKIILKTMLFSTYWPLHCQGQTFPATKTNPDIVFHSLPERYSF